MLPETGSQGPIFDHRQDGRQPPPDASRDATGDRGRASGPQADRHRRDRRRRQANSAVPISASFSFAWAAASRAIGTRGPEHDT